MRNLTEAERKRQERIEIMAKSDAWANFLQEQAPGTSSSNDSLANISSTLVARQDSSKQLQAQSSILNSPDKKAKAGFLNSLFNGNQQRPLIGLPLVAPSPCTPFNAHRISSKSESIPPVMSSQSSKISLKPAHLVAESKFNHRRSNSLSTILQVFHSPKKVLQPSLVFSSDSENIPVSPKSLALRDLSSSPMPPLRARGASSDGTGNKPVKSRSSRSRSARAHRPSISLSASIEYSDEDSLSEQSKRI